MGIKLAIIGSRSFKDKHKLELAINELNLDIDTVVSGGALGADKLGEEWAKNQGKKVELHLPEWAKYGRSAGIIRNKAIVESCDFCLAFWDGKSKGTNSSLELCKKLGIPYKVIEYQSA
jgi:hypothetical protein